MKYDNQLRYAVNIIRDYDGRAPLSVWLKDFYRANKQMGSRDRKTVSEMVYAYFRLGHNEFAEIDERILAATTLSGNLPEVTEYFRSNNTQLWHKSQAVDFFVSRIFPWKHFLSEGIDHEAFSRSFLSQPDLFLRVRPGKKEIVSQKLTEQNVAYKIYGDDCIAVPNSTRIDNIIDLNTEAAVQDLSSQKTGEFIKESESILRTKKPIEVWDCCAASGGKSIMAYDILHKMNLTVSDIRSTIIQNLKQRFRQAGITSYNAFVADLTNNNTSLPDKKYDLIIADVPCSGSGTWARTPEQLYFFRPERIEHYSQLQKNISLRVIDEMKSCGLLLYITCSVFAKENEEVVKFLTENSNLRLIKQQSIAGYTKKADSMYAALLQT